MISYTIRNSEIRNNIYIPKYYDPKIQEDIEQLRADHEIVSLESLIDSGVLEVTSGNEIGKMAYGTGNIPFIRTSDITNWELKTIPKQGVSQEIYNEWSERQDVRSGDILMVKDGDYLIGSNCMITNSDLPLLYQSHILKFRIINDDLIDPYLFFIILNSNIVQRQIRNVQFTADIIDTIGTRYLEVKLPIPKDKGICQSISESVKRRLKSREIGKMAIKQFPMLMEDVLESGSLERMDNFFKLDYDDQLSELVWNTSREEFGKTTYFRMNYSKLEKFILLPKYYNMDLVVELNNLGKTCELISIQDLLDSKRISVSTGEEIGKQCYGTGTNAFVRTSDFSNWELKVDPKQGVSDDIYFQYCEKTDVRSGDILLVRDGSYLIGTTCLITEKDSKLLYCGGIYKIRSNDESLDPYLLLALFNSYIVRQQIRTKQFTRDVIDTIGKRLMEIILPIPKEKEIRDGISTTVKAILQTRIDDREKLLELARQVELLDMSGESP